MTDESAGVARVLPDVSGIDRQFDYAIPAALAARIAVGTRVRVSLHGRRVGGWVMQIRSQSDAVDASRLNDIAKVTGHGPTAEIIALAEWGAERWVARRLRSLLAAASPGSAAAVLPPSARTGNAPAPASPATTRLFEEGGGVLRLPPRVDVFPSLLSAVGRGPTLAVVPSHATAQILATRLRRAGLSVASMPDEWVRAAAGVDIVIGPRVTAWAPCPDLAAAVIVDEHDEALQEERSPTWHARDVMVERCRRAAVPLVMISPAPTLVALEEHAPNGPIHPPRERERTGWPRVTVVDRRDEEPWKRSLVTRDLIEVLRDRERRVVCVSNITGRARVLACRTCRSLTRCQTCEAAVAMGDDGRLACRRCGTTRPPVCQVCGGSGFANLRPGITRLREELEAAAARPVVSVSAATASSERSPESAVESTARSADVYVGTEAVLHRVRDADVVAFLEFDSELLAPRYRAGEQALAFLIRAGRVAPEVMVQTFLPDHPVIAAAAAGDPSIVAAQERERREMLGFPPFGALAAVSGTALEQFLADLPDGHLRVGRDGDRALVRADDWSALSAALRVPRRPDGNQLRIEVDPPRV